MSMYEDLFRQALKAKRVAMGKGNRVKSYDAPLPDWLYPWAVEKSYADFLSKIFREVTNKAVELLTPSLPEIMKGDSAAYHADATPGPHFRTVMKTMSGWLATFFPMDGKGAGASLLLLGLGQEADKANGFNKKQWNKQTKSVLGFEFGTPESWYPGMKDQWAEKNYELIKSAASAYTGQINDVVEKAVVNGWSVADVKKMIKKMGDQITDSKARLLARDQIGKLNGMMTKTRQEEIGIKFYNWRTANDERVRGNPAGVYPKARPSHFIMEGKLCSWENASLYSDDKGKTWKMRPDNAPKEHPGMPIQCRCTALGNFDFLLNDVDQSLGDSPKPITAPSY